SWWEMWPPAKAPSSPRTGPLMCAPSVRPAAAPASFPQIDIRLIPLRPDGSPYPFSQNRMQLDGRKIARPPYGCLGAYVEKPLNGSLLNYPTGESPMGIIMYTPDGYMSAQLMRPNPGHFASTNVRFWPGILPHKRDGSRL